MILSISPICYSIAEKQAKPNRMALLKVPFRAAFTARSNTNGKDGDILKEFAPLSTPAKRKPAFHDSVTAVLFILPAVVPLFAFWVWPILRSFQISFTDWDFMTPDFNNVGLDNYLDLLQDGDFFKALLNTLVFAVGSTLPTLALGLALAMVLSSDIRGMGIYRTVLFSPWITPMVAVCIVWAWIFEPRAGLGNTLLSFFGLPKSEWTHSMKSAMASVLIVTVWKSIGWIMIFYLEALRKVPRPLIEAARMDGATPWKQFLNITLPMISPITFFLVVMSTINALQAYDQIQVLTQGGPAGATRTILYFYYQEAFESFNVGKASAVAFVLIFISAALSFIETAVSKKFVYYE